MYRLRAARKSSYGYDQIWSHADTLAWCLRAAQYGMQNGLYLWAVIERHPAYKPTGRYRQNLSYFTDIS
jgi:hypothetical protein